MKLVVFGSRSFNNKERMWRILDRILNENDLEIVQGDCRGADLMAKAWAIDRGVVHHDYPADWDTHGRSAGHKRNAVMAGVADEGLCFWDGTSPGTKGMIDIMQKKGKPVDVIKYVPEVRGNLWAAHKQGSFIVITTNTQCRQDGTAIMGGGIALAAAQRYKGLDAHYGKHLRSAADPEKPVYLLKDRLILLPTKREVHKLSPLDLVEKNILWLKALSENHPTWRIALIPLGCGLGGLDWGTQVQPLVDEHLSNGMFTVYKND